MEEKAVEETEDEDETEAEVEVTSVGRHGGAPVAPEAVGLECASGTLEGDAVGVGMPLAEALGTQPMPKQTYPGMQQPPPRSAGQLTASEGQLATPPPHVAPSGQHATCPASELDTSVQYVPSGQHLLSAPMLEQLSIPLGHAARF